MKMSHWCISGHCENKNDLIPQQITINYKEYHNYEWQNKYEYCEVKPNANLNV